MLTWLGNEYKGRTIRNDKIEYHRFIMPFYEEWMDVIFKNMDFHIQTWMEMDYIKSKVDDEWFALFDEKKKEYLLIDNRTRQISFTKNPRFFVDTRIPISDVPEVLRVFGFDLNTYKNKINIVESRIDKALEYLDNQYEQE